MKRTLVILGPIVLVAGSSFLWWRLTQSSESSDPLTEQKSFFTLDGEKQERIWNLEHTTFELEAKFAKQFTTALSNRNEDALKKSFRPGFSGTTLDPGSRVTLERGGLQERLGDVLERRQADTGRLVEHLIGYLADFKHVGQIDMRVLAIDPEKSDPAASNWKLTLLLRGHGRGFDGGPVSFESTHLVQCHFSSDREIAAGRIITRWDVESESLRKSPEPLMEEVTRQVGLDQFAWHDNWTEPPERVTQFTAQIAVEDFDRDGYLDIAVACFDERFFLLRSIRGKKFVDVTDTLGIRPFQSPLKGNYLACWVDYDNDGFPDLILGGSLYHNLQGKRFENVTGESNLEFGYQPMGCVVSDYNCDGLLDLYVLYQTSPKRTGAEPGFVGDEQSGAENHLWKNEGGGKFRNVSTAARVGGGKGQTFAAAWFHANDDSYPDLYLANDFGPNVLLVNRGNDRFEDVSSSARVGDYATSMGVAAGDVDNDGIPEIYVANMYSKAGRRIIAHVSKDDYPGDLFEQIRGSCAGNRLYKTSEFDSPYRESSERFGVNKVGWAFAPVFVDLDGNGYLDIYATTGFLSFRRDKPDG